MTTTDIIGVATTSTILRDGNNVYYNAAGGVSNTSPSILLGTVSTLSTGIGKAFQINFNVANITGLGSVGSTAAVQELLRAVSFGVMSDKPSSARTLTVTLNDGTSNGVATTTVGVTASNDAPTLTGVNANSYLEGQVSTVIDADVTLADADSADFSGGAVTVANLLAEDLVSVRSQALATGAIQLSGADVQYSADGTSWTTIGTLAGGNGTQLTISLNAASTPTAVDALIQNLTYRTTADAPTASRTLSLTVRDGDGGSVSQSVVIGVTATNDAPLATGSATLAAVQSGTASPAGATVSSLFAANFSDADVGGCLSGIAIVANPANPNTQGAWQYSADGTTWSDVGTVAATSALVLTTGMRLRFVAVSDYTGIPWALTVRLIDNSATLTGGSTVNLSVTGTGGTTPYSAGTMTLNTEILPTNSAPTPASASVALAATDEDTVVPVGATVSALFADNFSDAEGHALAGVAIVGNTANAATQGRWQYYTGSSWANIGTVSDAGALVVGVSSYLRFVPVPNYNGTPDDLTVRLIDSSTGAVANGSVIDLSADGVTGGNTAYSGATVALATSVTAVNDAPTVSGSAVLAAIGEGDTNGVGARVASLFSGTFHDIDAGSALGGIAIVGNTVNTSTQGTWQYSVDGTLWSDITTAVSGAAAVSLTTADYLRFRPVSDFNGTPTSLTVRLADNSLSLDPGSIVNVTEYGTGGSNAFSAATLALATSVTAINDPPTVSVSGTVTVVENAVQSAAYGGTGAPVRLDPTATVADLLGFAGGYLKVTGVATTDIIGVAATGTVLRDGNNIYYNAAGGVSNTAPSLLLGTVSTLNTGVGKAFQITFNTANISGLGAAGSTAAVQELLRAVSFGVTSDTPSSARTLTVTLNDGTASGIVTTSVGVTASNDGPTLTGLVPNGILEGSVATVIDADVTLTDADSADFSGGTVTVANLLADDRVSVRSQSLAAGAIQVNDADVQYSATGTGWTTIGTLAGGNGATLTISLNAASSPTAVEALIENLIYRTMSDAPTASRTLSLTVSDGDGGSVTQSVAIAVTATNDAPLAFGGATLAAVPSGTAPPAGATVASLFAANFSDVDGDSLNGVAIVANPANAGTQGVWQYSADGTTWSDVGAVAATSALALTTDMRLRFVPVAGFVGTPTGLTVRLIDSSATITAGGSIDLGVTGTGGTTPYSAGTVTLGTDILPGNSAPAPASAAVALAATAEDTTIPAGTTVNALFANVFTDGDGDSLAGVAIIGNTADPATQGRWQYHTGGGWADVGTVSGASALIVGASGWLRFVPAPNYTGTPDGLTVHLIDGSAGPVATGAVVDLSVGGATGGITAYSAATVALGTGVTAVNDAPTVGGTAVLAAIDEDDTGGPGGRVAALFSGAFHDIDAGGALGGIVIVGNTADTGTQGSWQYSADGTLWSDLATTLSDAAAFSLTTADYLRFRPAGDFNGAPDSLTVRLLDNSFTLLGTGSLVNLGDYGVGGASPFSAATLALATSVTAVNDAPTASGPATLAAVAEDATAPAGASVHSLFAGSFADIDGGDSLAGIAVVGNAADATTQGAWQYSTDGGGSWVAMGGVGAAGALTLAGDDRLRFVPVADYHGTPGGLSVHLIDSSMAVVRAAILDLTTAGTGGTTGFSAATVALTTSVTAVNDAPVASGPATLAAVLEDATAPAGASVHSLFAGNFTDIDGGDTLAGIAVVGNAADTTHQGAWQYSTDDGVSWSDLSTGLTAGAALTLAGDDRLRFVPAADYNGTPGGLSVHLIDSSMAVARAGTLNLTTAGTGGTTGFSAATVALATNVTAVNDAPVIIAPGGTQAASSAILTVVAGLQLSDVDATTLTVTLRTSNGGLIAIDPGIAGGLTAAGIAGSNSDTVTLVGGIAAINTTLAAATGVRYTPSATYSGMETLTVTASDDGEIGTGGPQVDSAVVAFAVAPRLLASQSFSLAENAAAGSLVGTLDVRGSTQGMSFAITSGQSDNFFFQGATTPYFAIDSLGRVTLTAAGAERWDFEDGRDQTQVTLSVAVTQSGLTSAAQSVTLSVTDTPDLVLAASSTQGGQGVLTLDARSVAGTAAAATLDLAGSSVSGGHDPGGDGLPLDWPGFAHADASALTAWFDGATVRTSGAFAILIGTGADNSLVGSAGSDSLYGGSGDDTLLAGAGRDTLVGGLGADRLNGGTAEDTYILSFGGGLAGATASGRIVLADADVPGMRSFDVTVDGNVTMQVDVSAATSGAHLSALINNQLAAAGISAIYDGGALLIAYNDIPGSFDIALIGDTVPQVARRPDIPGGWLFAIDDEEYAPNVRAVSFTYDRDGDGPAAPGLFSLSFASDPATSRAEVLRRMNDHLSSLGTGPAASFDGMTIDGGRLSESGQITIVPGQAGGIFGPVSGTIGLMDFHTPGDPADTTYDELDNGSPSAGLPGHRGSVTFAFASPVAADGVEKLRLGVNAAGFVDTVDIDVSPATSGAGMAAVLNSQSAFTSRGLTATFAPAGAGAGSLVIEDSGTTAITSGRIIQGAAATSPGVGFTATASSASVLTAMDEITFVVGQDRFLFDIGTGPSSLYATATIASADTAGLGAVFEQYCEQLPANTARILEVTTGTAQGVYLFVNDQHGGPAGYSPTADLFVKLKGVAAGAITSLDQLFTNSS